MQKYDPAIVEDQDLDPEPPDSPPPPKNKTYQTPGGTWDSHPASNGSLAYACLRRRMHWERRGIQHHRQDCGEYHAWARADGKESITCRCGHGILSCCVRMMRRRARGGKKRCFMTFIRRELGYMVLRVLEVGFGRLDDKWHGGGVMIICDVEGWYGGGYGEVG